MRSWSVRGGLVGSVVGFLGVSFFLFLSDAILSDWVPGFVQRVVGNAFLMGLIVSLSSVVGLFMDFVFSDLLSGSSVKKVIVWSLVGSLFFVMFLGLATIQPVIVWLLLAMAFWGFYYDLFSFFTQQFVVEVAPKDERSSLWSMVGFVRNLAYFIAPIIGTRLVVVGGDRSVIYVAGLMLAISGLLLSFVRFRGSTGFVHKKISIGVEMEHWRVLFGRVWPLLGMSLLLGLIDAVYWTAGTIVTDKLAVRSVWGGLFLPLYMLPSLIVGLFMSRKRIVNGKKRMALRNLLVAGVILSGLKLFDVVVWKLLVVFVSSVFLAFSWPLVNAVYSDLISRMGRKREHLLGLSDSMMNVAYIVGPVMSGLLSYLLGEEGAFVVVGVVVIVASMMLWVSMPDKLRLPQKDIEKWEV